LEFSQKRRQWKSLADVGIAAAQAIGGMENNAVSAVELVSTQKLACPVNSNDPAPPIKEQSLSSLCNHYSQEPDSSP
jgi:hypothetical protein